MRKVIDRYYDHLDEEDEWRNSVNSEAKEVFRVTRSRFEDPSLEVDHLEDSIRTLRDKKEHAPNSIKPELIDDLTKISTAYQKATEELQRGDSEAGPVRIDEFRANLNEASYSVVQELSKQKGGISGGALKQRVITALGLTE